MPDDFEQRAFINNTNATVTGGNVLAAAAWSIGSIAANLTAGIFTNWAFAMPNYAGTVGNKQMSQIGGSLGQTATVANALAQELAYRSTSAIVRLKIAAPATFKLKVGSQLLIYKRLAS